MNSRALFLALLTLATPAQAHDWLLAWRLFRLAAGQLGLDRLADHV